MKTILVLILFVANHLQAQIRLKDSIFIKSLKIACQECLDSSNVLTSYSQTLTTLHLILPTIKTEKNAIKDNDYQTLQDNYRTQADIDFSIFPKLEYLCIEGDLFTKITAWPSNLQALHLPANFVYTKVFPQLPQKLRYLQLGKDFSHSQEDKQLHFFDYQNLPNSLEVLIIEQRTKLNQLNYLPNRLKVLTIKNNAYITQNLFTNLPNTLKVLRLDSCQLSNLPDKLPDSLTHLYAQFNSLKTLPSLPPTLQTLVVNHNLLTQIDSVHFPKLQKLDVNHNKIQYLQLYAPNLSEVKVDSNQLDSLKIYSLKLKYLTCTNNRLRLLSIDKNAPLQELYCQYNQLTALPPLSDSLQMLNCSYNLLIKLPLLGTALHYIDYSGNKIRRNVQIPPNVQQVVSQTEEEIKEENKVWLFGKGRISITARRHYHKYKQKLTLIKTQQWQYETLLQDNPQDATAKIQLEKLAYQEQHLKRKYKRVRTIFQDKS
jgi:hypothetical protein